MTSTFSSGSSVDSIIWSSSQSFARSFCMSSEAVVAVRVRTVGFPVSGPAILQPNGIFSSLSRLTLSVPSNTQSSKSRLPMRMSTAPPKCGSERVSVFICQSSRMSFTLVGGWTAFNLDTTVKVMGLEVNSLVLVTTENLLCSCPRSPLISIGSGNL